MKKGISIIALTIYIIGFIAIIGILVSFNINVFQKSNEFIGKNKLNSEYIKFDMFLVNLIKNNNYIEVEIDENSNEVLLIKNRDRAINEEYITDEGTGEEVLSERYWDYDTAEEIGKITYDTENKIIYYWKYDSGYTEENKKLVCKYASSIDYEIVGSTVTVHVEYEDEENSFIPNDITYLMGRGT